MRNSAGSASQYNFTLVPDANIPRCRLRRPSTHKTVLNAGKLYPLFYDEVLPADTFKLDVRAIAHMTTLMVPIMDNIYMDWQFFYVPWRLVWDHFENMHGARKNPTDSIDYQMPGLNPKTGGVTVGSLSDYFGLPLAVEWNTDPYDVHCLFHRAYNLIWNEWYRDANLQNSVAVSTADTADDDDDYILLSRGKRKDYFTSALPSPQKGAPVILPIGSTAPVVGNGLTIGLTDGSTDYGFGYRNISGSHVAAGLSSVYGVSAGTQSSSGTYASKSLGLTDDPDKSGLIADLSNASGVSINAVRQAFQIQRLLERDSRGGCNRFTEILRAHFNVQSPDARLQRPEFLGSFTIPVNIHTVTQTGASVSGGTPQGNLSGVGVASGVNRAFTKSFVEHGCVIGLCSIRADLNYQQGIQRMFSRRTRFDMYYPALAHLGEQGILNKEIYAQGPSVVDAQGNIVDDMAFGYQERWSEYKFGYNHITGALRSTAASSLDVWHLAQKFTSLPTLNSTFITEDPPLDRSLAVSSAVAPQFVVDSFFDLECVRPMPLYDIPGFVDHF